MNSIERLISEQVHAWASRERKARKNNEIPESWPVITISRQYGALGRMLAKELGKLTGFEVWDKELLTAIAEEAGSDERFLASLDERRHSMIDDVLVGSLLGSKHSNTHYFRSLLKVVHTIGEHGKSIIVGRGGNYIIKSPKALRVRIVRPKMDRVKHISEKEGISMKNAEKLINDRDQERNDFIHYHFRKETTDASEYDLVLNSGIFNIGQMAELVLLAYEKKAGKAPELVRQ